jgi:hypothetical protein
MATKIICRAIDCIFWEDKICSTEEIIYDPDEGCLTYEGLGDLVDLDEDDDDDDELDDNDDDGMWDDDDGIWDDNDLDVNKWQS